MRDGTFKDNGKTAFAGGEGQEAPCGAGLLGRGDEIRPPGFKTAAFAFDCIRAFDCVCSGPGATPPGQRKGRYCAGVYREEKSVGGPRPFHGVSRCRPIIQSPKGERFINDVPLLARCH